MGTKCCCRCCEKHWSIRHGISFESRTAAPMLS